MTKLRNIKRWFDCMIKNITYRISLYFIELLHKAKHWSSSLQEGNLYSLGPSTLKDEDYKNDEDKVQHEKLQEIFDNALLDKNIKNIAVTGGYGSGKSTFLRSFEYKYNKHSYLNLSLASFKTLSTKDNKPNDNKSKENIDGKLIELSLLQQMFYHVKGSQIPFSRFKRIRHQSKRMLWIYSILSFIWLLSALYTFQNFSTLIDFFSKISYLSSIAMLIFLVGTAGIFKFIFEKLNSCSFTKLNLNNIEFEIDKTSDQSIFNEHLDEIIYFFQVTSFDVVIIEDLDRFEQISDNIFVKLRELNNLLNNSKQINKKITFVYAIKDDLFKNDERTKFFDYMIPIIPVINSTNSKEKLVERLKKENCEDQLSDYFLKNISLFITDMRMLTNIVNEYLIYKDRLSNELNQENLFAMMVYKNQHPNDFSQLNAGDGMLCKTLNKKNSLIKELTNSKKQEIKDIESKIEKSNNEILPNIKELRTLVIHRMVIAQEQTVESFTVNGKKVALKKLCEDNEFKSLVENGITGYQYYQEQNYYIKSINKRISFDEIEKVALNGASYKQRESNILNKNLRTKNELSKRISMLKNEISKIEEYKFYELIEHFNISDWDSEVKDSDLLKFLIRKGYLGENYNSYISNFYEGSLTIKDYDFIQKVKKSENPTFSHELTNFEEIITYFEPHELNKKYVLHFNLIDFLLQNQQCYETHIDCLFKGFIELESSYTKFIDEFIDTNSSNISEFIKKLCSYCPNLWIYIENKSKYEKEKIDKYLLLILKHASIVDICDMNIDDCLTNYISNEPNFLSLDIPYKKMIKVIQELAIEFVDIDIKNVPDKQLNFVYENYYYKINPQMVKIILDKYNTKEKFDISQLPKANYTTVMSSDCEDLKHYVLQGIKLYLQNVFFKIESNIEESEESIIAILNNSEVDINNKESLLKTQKNKLSQITKVKDNKILQYIVKEEAFVINWSNIIEYIAYTEEIDDYLKAIFSNSDHCKILSKKKLDTNDDTYKKLIALDDIPDDCYDYLMKPIPCGCPDIDFIDFNIEKVQILLKRRILQLSSDNYNVLKEHFKDLHIEFMANLIEKFLELDDVSDYNLEAEDYCNILEAGIVDDNNEGSAADGKINKIASLGDIPNKTIWKYIIKTETFVMNWENVIEYYTYVGEIDEYLENIFDNQVHCENLSLKQIEESENAEKICKSLITLNDISNECYDYLMESNLYSYPNHDFSAVSLEKAKILLKRNKLQLSSFNYDILKDYLENVHIEYITNFIKEFLDADDIHDYNIDSKDYFQLLESDKINDSYKEKIIDIIPLNYYDNEVELCNLVSQIILMTKQKVESELIDKLTLYVNDESLKIKLLVNVVSDSNHDLITDILTRAGGKYEEISIRGKKPHFEDTDLNRNLLEKLDNNYISSFNTTSNGKLRVNTFQN